MKKLFLISACLLFASTYVLAEDLQTPDPDTELEETIPPLLTTDKIVEEDAAANDIPDRERIKYENRLRTLNDLYQWGDITKTEYIEQKRHLLKRYK